MVGIGLRVCRRPPATGQLANSIFVEDGVDVQLIGLER